LLRLRSPAKKALNPHIGYEKAAQISLKAYREDLTLREAALKFSGVPSPGPAPLPKLASPTTIPTHPAVNQK